MRAAVQSQRGGDEDLKIIGSLNLSIMLKTEFSKIKVEYGL